MRSTFCASAQTDSLGTDSWGTFPLSLSLSFPSLSMQKDYCFVNEILNLT